MTTESPPFQVGVEVAVISHGWTKSIRKAVVTKVYKNGQFFLNDEPTRWSPDLGRARAHQSGMRGSRDSVVVWTEALAREAAEIAAMKARGQRLHNAQKSIERLRWDTVAEDVVAALEGAVALIDAGETS